jgi:hypothetical protein
VAVSLGILSVAYGYGDYALYARDNSLPGAELAAWVTNWLFIVAVYGSVCYLFLLFPNGRPTSPRWRPVVWGVTITALVAILAAALDPGAPSAFPTVKNPLQVGESIGRVARVANDITDLAAIPVFLVSLASMITRLRHARGRERLQLKWMTYAASLTATSFAVAFFASSLLRWQTVADIFFLLGVTGFASLPVAAGIAILRHRLYEIDVVINRTLVYGSLTAMLAVVYFGGVTATQVIFRVLTAQEQQPQIAIVVSTLVIAALFNPLRRRIQSFIDRRFYRRKYDAAKTLEAFSTKLRDETDLDTLKDDLVGVVRETMQPAHVSLWLRPDSVRRGSETSE